jgi:D-glycero-alpha-D-manno-heptose-7-phosphate kinase
MIISRAPFRISFFGGGTDYPVYYRENGGSVLSVSIDKYCYITCRYLPNFFEHSSRLVYSRTELVKYIDEIQHPSIRECLRFMRINQGIELHHDADLPARSGLGSSSTFTVALLHALYTLKGQMASKERLAKNAIYVEQELIGENVGSQDQTIAAYGGFNHISFSGNHTIDVRPVVLSKEKEDYLLDRLVLFFSGISRTASEIAGEQIQRTPKLGNELGQMQSLVNDALRVLQGSIGSLDDFGRLLHETWRLKRSLTGNITNAVIDDIYNAGINAGALGGKLLGAGGGGFVLFYVKPENKANLIKALPDLMHVPFRFDYTGSQIVYYQPQYDGSLAPVEPEVHVG